MTIEVWDTDIEGSVQPTITVEGRKRSRDPYVYLYTIIFSFYKYNILSEIIHEHSTFKTKI